MGNEVTKRASEDLLDLLHGELAKEFLTRIKNGSATAADLSAARQFLKDNGVNANPTKESPLGNLIATPPFAVGDPEYVNYPAGVPPGRPLGGSGRCIPAGP